MKLYHPILSHCTYCNSIIQHNVEIDNINDTDCTIELSLYCEDCINIAAEYYYDNLLYLQIEEANYEQEYKNYII